MINYVDNEYIENKLLELKLKLENAQKEYYNSSDSEDKSYWSHKVNNILAAIGRWQEQAKKQTK